MQNDRDQTLEYVRGRSGNPLYRNILDIQAKIPIDTRKISSIRCVEIQGDHLYASPIVLHYARAARLCPYIAVSCPWEIASPDDVITGKYHIDLDSGMHRKKMPQDVVLDRVINYARFYKMPFWIDKLCIDQCNGCDEKRIAIQSMDLVYANSRYTVGLLFMRIDLRKQVNRLYNLLSGAYVVESRLKRNGCSDFELKIPPSEARAVLDVIESILDDAWWKRGWIFQEEYLSGTRMRLLIRSSERYILGEEIFGKIEGELEINAVRFRVAITKFCLAYQQPANVSQAERTRCRSVLEKAGRYSILLAQDEQQKSLVSMSPTILQEIVSRDITDVADVLAIAANSCGYSRRLDPGKLNEKRMSLSLAILTLCLLNGEILRPSFAGIDVGSTGKIFNFLSQSVLRLEPPLGMRGRALTFAKHCRFTDVELSRAGIGTKGIIWKLGKKLNSARYHGHYRLSKSVPQRPWERRLSPQQPHCLDYYEHEALWRIQRIVKKHKTLANHLKKFLIFQAQQGYVEDWSRDHLMYLMATHIARAFLDGKQLWLGCIWRGDDEPSAYEAIFVANRNAMRRNENRFAFTSWAPATEAMRGDLLLDRCDSKYVSLEVQRVRLSGPKTAQSATAAVKGWMNGLCFFQNDDAKSVIIEWPQYLRGP